MLKWLMIILTVVTSSAGDILSAKGMSSGGELDFGVGGIGRAIKYIITRKMVILGGLCYVVAFFSLLSLLSVAQLSVAVPATALSFVTDTIGAYFILHERVHWRRWLGVICVTAGVVLTVQSGRKPVLAGARTAATASVQPHKH
jgi:drug/metabolite transporter (DMT)-like permease